MPSGLPPAGAFPTANAAQSGRAALSAHILLVDDDPAVRGTVTLLLENAGYRVGCAPDGEAGWHALCAAPSDLLITDYEMPKLTGLELLRRVRAVSRHMPAILMSGCPPRGEADLESLLKPGAVIPKPFSIGALLATVQELLHGSLAGPPADQRAGWPLASRQF
jgi:DNA-binding response OmpR family regulator